MLELPRFPDFVTIHWAFESRQSGIAGQIASIICRLLLFIALQHLKEVSPPIVISIASLLNKTFFVRHARYSPIFEIALMDPLWARVYIDEVHLGQIKMGQKVTVSVDSYPDRTFDATVGFISSVAEFTPKTVQTEAIRTNLVYEVRLTVQDPEGLLRLGMPVTARLVEKVQ